MSEKFDGIRAYWNCKILISRHGNKISNPSWFIEEFPKDITLDGELWMGRGTFELLRGIINGGYKKDDLLWKQIYFMLFDLPNSKEEYEKRIFELKKLKLPNHVNIVDIQKCKGKDHLQEYLQQILEYGGEGIMLNQPNSFYISTRTNSLFENSFFFTTKWSHIPKLMVIFQYFRILLIPKLR